jgi:hypothetical protein
MEINESALIALGDQVEPACRASQTDAVGFVVITKAGVEYRSPFPIEEFRKILHQVADAL